MKTRSREPLMTHNRERHCGGCSKVIYVDQDYFIIGAGGISKEYFHTNQEDCMETISLILTNRRH